MSLSVTRRHQNILFPEGMFPKMKLMSGCTCPVCNHRRRVVSAAGTAAPLGQTSVRITSLMM